MALWRAGTTKLASNYVYANFGYEACYWCSLSFATLAFLSAVIFVKEPHRKEREMYREMPLTTKIKNLFTMKHIYASFGELFAKRQDGIRAILIIAAIMTGIQTMVLEGDNTVLFGYVRAQYEWETMLDFADWMSTYAMTVNLYQLFGLGIITPLLSRVLHCLDNTIIFLGLVGFLSEYITLLLSNKQNLVYLGVAINVLGFSVDATCAALASKIVSADRLGRILACFSFVNVLATLITPLMSYTYSETVDWNPGFVYCLLCGILGISLLLSLWVFVKQRMLLKKYEKEGKIVPFLHHKKD